MFSECSPHLIFLPVANKVRANYPPSAQCQSVPAREPDRFLRGCVAVAHPLPIAPIALEGPTNPQEQEGSLFHCPNTPPPRRHNRKQRQVSRQPRPAADFAAILHA